MRGDHRQGSGGYLHVWLVLAGPGGDTMSEAYNQGWADYRSALYLSDEEIQVLLEANFDNDEWRKGWFDASAADDILMD